MGSFYATPTPTGHVYNELLQSEDFGKSWKQLAPHRQFIPHGPPGSVDSSIIYAAMPMLNPANASETYIYYDGGVGPHSGPHREDTLNLALASSSAFAGLRHDGDDGPARLRMQQAELATGGCEVLAKLDAGSSLSAVMGERAAASAGSSFRASETMTTAQWIPLEPARGLERQGRDEVGDAVDFELDGAGTLFAMRCSGSAAAADSTSAEPPKVVDVFGSEEVQCSGAQMVATKQSLLVWGICAPNGEYPSKNLTINMRRSTDWGLTFGAPIAQPQPTPSLAQIVYNPKTDSLVSMARWDSCANATGCPSKQAFGCASTSTDEGVTWTPAAPAGCRPAGEAGGSGEGCGGTTLSSGTMLSPFGVSTADYVISSEDGKTWQVGGPTPALPSKQGWGECMVAELANGSVVITSRLSDRVGRHTAPIQRGFAISHDQAKTWEKAWTFPAAQPFSSGFGPGYNVENALITAANKTQLLLSKPTATLSGDASGKRPNCARGTQGSCGYRRNLTIATSADGGASWSIEPWGLVYPERVAYSFMAELPSGKVAVVFERGTPQHEYRYVSVAVVTPSWAA